MAKLGDFISPAKNIKCGDGKYPVLSMTMHDGIVLQSDRFKKSLASADQSGYKVVDYGQLVVGFPIDEGVLYLQRVIEQGIMSPAYNVWDVDYSHVDPSYFELSLHSPQAMQYYKENLRGSTARRRSLPKEVLLELPLKMPSMDEQKRVATSIDKLTHLIDMRSKQLDKLDELVKSRFIEMFDSVEELCEVGYYIKSLIAGKSLAGEAECENKVLKTGAASFNYFDASQVKNLPLDYEPKSEHLVSVGDIIISRMNTAELTGAAAYVWDVPKNIYVPDRLWKAVLTESSNPIFVWQMLIQPSTKEQIQRECSGTSGSMKNISKAGLLSIKVKKVSLDLQNQFADFVAQVDKSKLAVQKSLEQLEILKKALMQEYFG